MSGFPPTHLTDLVHPIMQRRAVSSFGYLRKQLGHSHITIFLGWFMAFTVYLGSEVVKLFL